MSKLIDTEKLARLSKALDSRAKAMVEAERQRAVAAEEAIAANVQLNKEAIEAINHAETGILAQAKAHAEAQDEALEGRLTEVDNALKGRLDGIDAAQLVQDGKIKANTDAIAVLNGDENQEGSVKKQIKDAIDEVNNAASELEGRVEDCEGRLDDIDAAQLVQNAAIEAAQAAADKAQQEVDAVEERMLAAEGRLDDIDAEQEAQDAAIEAAQAAADKAQGEVDAAELRIKANEDAIGVLNGDENQEGSVAKAVKDAVDPVQADLDELEAVVGAPAEGETPATGLHKIVADGDAKALQDAKDYADQKITELVNSAPEAMDTLGELADAIEAHQDVYEGYVAQVAEALSKKVDKIENHRLVSETEIAGWNAKAEISDVQEALQDAKNYTDAEIEKVNQAAGALEGRVADLEGKVGHDADGENPATGLFLEVDQAKAAADQAQQEVDAVEGRVDAIEAEQDTQDGKIQANADAIGVLNGGVEQEGSVAKSIADALEEYSTTEEMKQLLGNVVNSLSLTMENDKVVLKLGGVDGIAITEVSLDMATDADIDAIINGLDEEEGE